MCLNLIYKRDVVVFPVLIVYLSKVDCACGFVREFFSTLVTHIIVISKVVSLATEFHCVWNSFQVCITVPKRTYDYFFHFFAQLIVLKNKNIEWFKPIFIVGLHYKV